MNILFKFANRDALRIVGLISLVSLIFIYKDFNDGDFNSLFNKTATVAAISALVMAIFTDASANHKIYIQNLKSLLNSKLEHITNQFNSITLDFWQNQIGRHVSGGHAFRVAMGQINSGTPIFKNDIGAFAFWEAKLTLKQIDKYLQELLRYELDLGNHFYTTSNYSLDYIYPMLSLYESFYNAYYDRRERISSEKLDEVMDGIKLKLDIINEKVNNLKVLMINHDKYLYTSDS